MMYGDDETAVAKYLRANPEQALYLVDTYDSIDGINTFCKKCKELGVTPKGIRLDSGDISKLSHQARKILDDYGYEDALIVVSDGLDKHDIMRHILNDDPISSFGVGSRLVSPKMDPMNIVYKLCAVHNGQSIQEVHALMEEARKQGGPPPYRPEMKVSEMVGKSSLPGVHQILRLYDENKGAYRGDLVVFDHEVDLLTSQDTDGTLRLGNDIKGISRAGDQVIYPAENTVVEIPLTTVFNNGRFSGDRETIKDARQRLKNQRDKLPRQVRAICDPTDYPVHLSEDLHAVWQTGLTT
jgi:nicotinate phosphoribosyltransferase